ncbi:MAG: hypothetical protein J6C27_04275 [Clostridia bacterium]|nr:hypothetical protein [Clostridia bacterium]
MENLNVLNIGERFEFKGFEWKVLDKDESGIFAVMTDFWQTLPFDTNNCNNWEKSSLRRVLNSEFLDIIGKKNLVPVESDLIADNGDRAYGKTTDYITILSCDQIRKYFGLVPKYESDWSWTLTPWSCISGGANRVRSVYPTGTIYDYGASNSNGVAPACKFASSNLKLCRQAHLVEVDGDE